MNYHQPRQIDPLADRPDAGKWRYTNMNDGRIWPEGYCSPYMTCPDCEGQSMFSSRPQDACSTCDSKGVVDVEEPCPGHDTKEGAYEHMTQYVLDHRMRLDVIDPDQMRHCEVCGVWTDSYAEVDHRTFRLCGDHRTREKVTELYGSVGDSFGSY